MAVDDFGRVVFESGEDIGVYSFDYNSSGLITEQIDSLNQATRFEYDASDQLIKASYADGTSSEYSYQFGLLTRVRGEHQSESFKYDDLGRIIERTIDWGNGVQKAQKFSYNKVGQLESETLASGQTLSYTYTEFGEIEEISVGDVALLSSANSSSDTAKELTYELGNGERVVKGFTRGQLTRMAVEGRDKRTGKKGEPLPKIERQWSYNRAGNIDKSWSNDKENIFTFDAQDRLTGSMTQSGRSKYAYDNNDNQVSALVNGSASEYQYLQLNNQLSEVKPELAEPYSLAYDIAGNLIQSGGFEYQYNAQGRLASVSRNDYLVGEYTYNSWGQRSSKKGFVEADVKSQRDASSQITYFLYTDNKLAAEFNDEGEQVVDYVYYDDLPIAKITDEGIFYIHVNAQGAPEWMTDEQQKIVWHADYQPYGELLIDQDAEPLNIRLPGQYHDHESGLYYNINRYYSPSLGRYITPDPSGFIGGMNRYAYASANPSRYVDPLGLEACVSPTPSVIVGDGSSTSSPGEGGGEPGIDGFDHDWKAELALDVIGIFEPTPFADIANGSALMADGRYIEGVLTYLGVVPIVGDVIGKGGKYIFKGGRALFRVIPWGRVGDAVGFVARHGWDALKWTGGKGLDALRWTGNRGMDALRWTGRSVRNAGGWLGDKIGGVFRRSSDDAATRAATCSFHGDTEVLTADGYTKIQDVVAGQDLVWSKDEQTDEFGWRTVTAKYSNQYKESIYVTIDNGSDKEQTLISNAIHPFFVKLDAKSEPAAASSEGLEYNGQIANGHWIDAANLKTGYKLLTDQGGWVSVVNVSRESEHLTAFNLKVEEYQTYFVKGLSEIDGPSVWVHNDCDPTDIQGGAHRDTRRPVNDQLDSHHCPAKACYSDAPISSLDGPAIKMDPADHRRTASYGSSDEAVAYRARQQELLEQGRLDEAIQMDIDDIRSKFGDKYDDAIQEMLDYADTLNPEDFIPD